MEKQGNCMFRLAVIEYIILQDCREINSSCLRCEINEVKHILKGEADCQVVVDPWEQFGFVSWVHVFYDKDKVNEGENVRF